MHTYRLKNIINEVKRLTDDEFYICVYTAPNIPGYRDFEHSVLVGYAKYIDGKIKTVRDYNHVFDNLQEVYNYDIIDDWAFTGHNAIDLLILEDILTEDELLYYQNEWYGIPKKQQSKSKYDRRVNWSKKLKRLANETDGKWRGGVYHDKDKNRYIRWSYSDKSKAPRKLKKISNKKVRHYKQLLNNGCSYKKVFDYWWWLL